MPQQQSILPGTTADLPVNGLSLSIRMTNTVPWKLPPLNLALLWQFFHFHRCHLRFAFPIRNSYPTDIPRKVPLNCQSSARHHGTICHRDHKVGSGPGPSRMARETGNHSTFSITSRMVD